MKIRVPRGLFSLKREQTKLKIEAGKSWFQKSGNAFVWDPKPAITVHPRLFHIFCRKKFSLFFPISTVCLIWYFGAFTFIESQEEERKLCFFKGQGTLRKETRGESEHLSLLKEIDLEKTRDVPIDWFTMLSRSVLKKSMKRNAFSSRREFLVRRLKNIETGIFFLFRGQKKYIERFRYQFSFASSRSGRIFFNQIRFATVRSSNFATHLHLKLYEHPIETFGLLTLKKNSTGQEERNAILILNVFFAAQLRW